MNSRSVGNELDPQALWSAVLSTLADRIGPQSFDTWFRPLACAGGDATTLRLLVPNENFGRNLLDSYGGLLRQTAADIRGAPCQLVIATPAPEPDPAPSADTLPVVQAAALEQAPAGRNWLIENLWLAETVGFLGSPPKHCKTWLALEMAVCVASGSPCLGVFPVPDPGPVLLYAAEDPTATVRQRLESLAAHHQVDLNQLPLWVITADSLRLDRTDDSSRLEATVARYQPRLLILDPLIRLHQQDENASGPMAALLGFFRALQRKSRAAIAIIHHSRKNRAPAGSGYNLRGSSDFYAWADVFLHLQRRQGRLTLTAEHRSAPSFGPIAIELVHLDGGHPHLQLVAHDSVLAPDPTTPNTIQPDALCCRILELLSESSEPRTVAKLRSALRVRNQRLVEALRQLTDQRKISRLERGYVVQTP
jgi:hypothetical protein